jgi:hypothetical protein
MDHSKPTVEMVADTTTAPASVSVDAAASIPLTAVPARATADVPACDTTGDTPYSASGAGRSRASRNKRALAEVGDVIPAADASGSPQQNLRPGDQAFGRTRHPPIPERIGAAASLVLDKDLGELMSLVLRGVKARSIPVTAARLLLDRLLPNGRHIKLDLPTIRCADDLDIAHRIILSAVNDGRITPSEAREVQAVIAEAWKARLEAHEHPNLGGKETIDPEAYRERICMAARRYGMVMPDEALGTASKSKMSLP